MFELTERALVGAPPTTVWHDFTDADSLASWFWPPRLESRVVVEPVELGRWEVSSPVAGIAVEGRIVALDAPRTLRLRWQWEGEDDATDVEIVLEETADASTRVIVHHSGFGTSEERQSHIEGWADCLQRLVERHA